MKPLPPHFGRFQSLENRFQKFPIIGKPLPKVSNDWKIVRQLFQSLETLYFGRRTASSAKTGAALIVALWVLMILSLLIGTFAFEMHIEAGITSYHRKKLKAQYLARAGVEYARMLLVKSLEESAAEAAASDAGQRLVDSAKVLNDGFSASSSFELGKGMVHVQVKSVNAKYNINQLVQLNGVFDELFIEQWDDICEVAGLDPQIVDIDELRYNLGDWIDENDTSTGGLGAESDDSFYEDAGYKCKDGPLDTIDELMLIKGFTHEVVYGGKYGEGDDAIQINGLASVLSTWGSGKVNLLTASDEVLQALGLSESEIASLRTIIEEYFNDPKNNTKPDLNEICSLLGVSPEQLEDVTIENEAIYYVTSIGEVEPIRAGIWSVMQVTEESVTPIFWREEAMD